MASMDTSVGALLIGTWVNCMLFMLEIMQAITFFKRFPRERRWIKHMVSVAVLLDLLGTANNNIIVYMYTITHWGDKSFLLIQPWPVPAYVVFCGLSACLTQQFLTWRFWVLTKNWWITPWLSAFSLTSLAGALFNTATVIRYPTYAERDHLIRTVTLWLVASVVADIAIAVALVWALRSMSTSFKATRSLLRRLTATAISTGSATSLLATVCLVFYLANTELNITVGFGFTIGRAYTLTMLYNLNQRKKGRAPAEHTVGPTGASALAFHDVERADITLGQITHSGNLAVGVHQTAVVHIDDGSKGYYVQGNRSTDNAHRDSHSDAKAPVGFE